MLTPYSSAAPLMGQPPAWITDGLDALRVQSYSYYSALYANLPEYFAVNLRGENEAPVWVPSPRILIEAVNRFFLPGFSVDATSLSGAATESTDVVEARTALRNLLARERFLSKLGANKRNGLTAGDMLWHVTADESKPEGSRISITPVDPAQLFLIFDEDDVDRVIGCHLVEQIVNAKGDARIRRQTYMKYIDGEGDSAKITITIEDGVFKLDEWGDPDALAEEITLAETELPEDITAIPVYHWRNNEEVGNPYGSSELRGLERIINSLNQAMSDQDLTLAMAGLGQWTYHGPPPTDDGTEAGNPVGFTFGPGRVLVLPEGAEPDALQHIKAASTVGPYGEHIDRLWQFLLDAAALSPEALGKTSGGAESGIARMLKFAPLLAKTAEKNTSAIDVHRQMFHDILTMWFPAYEGVAWEDVTAKCSVGSALPIDRGELLAELKQLLADGVIDTVYYRERLRELGYTFPDDMAARVAAEQDRFAARAAADLDTPTDGGGE